MKAATRREQERVRLSGCSEPWKLPAVRNARPERKMVRAVANCARRCRADSAGGTRRPRSSAEPSIHELGGQLVNDHPRSAAPSPANSTVEW